MSSLLGSVGNGDGGNGGGELWFCLIVSVVVVVATLLLMVTVASLGGVGGSGDIGGVVVAGVGVGGVVAILVMYAKAGMFRSGPVVSLPRFGFRAAPTGRSGQSGGKNALHQHRPVYGCIYVPRNILLRL